MMLTGKRQLFLNKYCSWLQYIQIIQWRGKSVHRNRSSAFGALWADKRNNSLPVWFVFVILILWRRWSLISAVAVKVALAVRLYDKLTAGAFYVRPTLELPYQFWTIPNHLLLMAIFPLLYWITAELCKCCYYKTVPPSQFISLVLAAEESSADPHLIQLKISTFVSIPYCLMTRFIRFSTWNLTFSTKDKNKFTVWIHTMT